MEQPREGKELIDATRPFAEESRARSWWYAISTFALWSGAIAAAAVAPWLWVRIAASVLAGLLTVRGFILYHDFMHGAFLRGSLLARAFMYLYGCLVLTPPKVWRQTHNYHHANNAKIVGSHVGSYPMLTVSMWQDATPVQRFFYGVVRHPLTILTGYAGIFIYGMCIASFLRRPKANWDSLFALALHFGLVAAITFVAGWQTMVLTLLLPLAIACAMGAYLFYAQHNFEGVLVQPREVWSYTKAAARSSSYMKMNPVMHWFTGNIGYHHVHHLNPSIPFYRLREAMDAIPEMQDPGITSLRPSDIAACFRLKLWDPNAGKMVGYPS